MTVTSKIAVIGFLGWIVMSSACAEKKSVAPATGPAAGAGTDSDSESPGGFNLCDNGLKAVTVAGFESYVAALCDGEKSKISALRVAGVVYKGGEPKIYKDDPKKNSTETSLRIYTSALVDASVNDYWSLMQLQLKKAAAYRDNYEYDTSASLSEIKVDSSKVSYRYVNDAGNGGRVDYAATTKFVVLKEDQAYMTTTKLDKSYETMEGLTGLVIINKVSSTKTEVFTMSDQTYSHQDNQGDAVEDEAIDTAGQEQSRMYKNAKKADEAPDLL